MKAEPITAYYRAYTLLFYRTRGSNGNGYFTCTGYRQGYQNLYSHGNWTNCLAGIRALIDEDLRVELLLRSKLIEVQSAEFN
jgi:hypothetical protein